jgi:hypothetical protein
MQSAAILKSLSFADIVQDRDASVRVTDDGMLCAIDLVVVVTGLDRNHSGNTIRNLDPALFDPSKFSERQLSTKGGPKTKLLRYHDAIELVMVLPGVGAKESRKQFAKIIQRYMAGDKTLATEIQTNATAISPITQLAQSPLPSSLEIPEPNVGEKRKYNDSCTPRPGELTEQQMKFVLDAFNYQKEIITLQHTYYGRLLTDDAAHCDETIEDMLARMSKENTTLRQDAIKDANKIEEMKTRLEMLKTKRKETQTNKGELIESIRILSGLHTELEHPTPYMRRISQS